MIYPKIIWTIFFLSSNPETMQNPLIRKLEQFTRLSVEDKRVLADAAGHSIRRLRPREDIVREGARPQAVSLFLDGWACRYKTLDDGRRQITSFFIPGDLCDVDLCVMREMDHSVGTLTAVTVAAISRDFLQEITERHHRLKHALCWAMLVNAATQREWILSLGQRSALERMAHLLCELFVRLRGVGLTNGVSCELPVTQAEFADAMGLSPVHVNRTLQELRGAGLVVLKGRVLTIPDLAALQRAGLFNDNYLHLGHEGKHLDANDG